MTTESMDVHEALAHAIDAANTLAGQVDATTGQVLRDAAARLLDDVAIIDTTEEANR